MAVSLLPGMQVVALRLQESMMHGDVRSRLSDAITDKFRGTGDYGYYVDHSGDGDSGDVIYSHNGDIRKAPYEIGSVGGKSTTNIDHANSTNVVPTTTYQEEADDDDYYSSMEESFKREALYTELPLYERFISKDERSSASEDDFAGKGKSFPILKPEDVSAAVHAMGRAGDKNVGMSTLKSRIIAIAKRKGWTKYLPKTWQGDASASESAARAAAGPLKLVESWDWREQALDLIEASGAPVRMKIKLIAPGKGSSAFYPAEVLRRDGPKVFGKGTHIYINHATAAEEAARPEGDWHKLAGALDAPAYWDESAKQGPGLYGDALFTSDHAPLIKEKAPFTGMSIRASGVAESDKKREGLPVLKELTSAESVDVVTRAGAGGMILTESARTENQQEVEMTKDEVLALIRESNTAASDQRIKALEARALRSDAMIAATRIMATMSLHEAAKGRVLEHVTSDGMFPVKDGSLDMEAFKTLVIAEAQREGTYLAQILGNGRVVGMGTGAAVEITEAERERQLKEAKRQRKEEKRMVESDVDVFTGLMGDATAGKNAALREVA